jgi:hypothetical protein
MPTTAYVTLRFLSAFRLTWERVHYEERPNRARRLHHDPGHRLHGLLRARRNFLARQDVRARLTTAANVRAKIFSSVVVAMSRLCAFESLTFLLPF